MVPVYFIFGLDIFSLSHSTLSLSCGHTQPLRQHGTLPLVKGTNGRMRMEVGRGWLEIQEDEMTREIIFSHGQELFTIRVVRNYKQKTHAYFFSFVV